MAATSPPLPIKDAIANLQTGKITQAWIEALSAQQQQINASPSRLIAPVGLETQAASIGTTPLTTGTLGAGLYRVSVYARITRAATVSSSLTVTISWTEGAVSLSLSGAAMTANTTNTVQTSTYLLLIDAGSPVSYSATYASAGATTMQYRLVVVIERVAA